MTASIGMTPRQGDLLDLFKEAIFHERVRAHAKHGATSMEQSEPLHHRRASILTEEAVECAKALNDHEHGEIALKDIDGSTPAADSVWMETHVVGDELDKELIQTAAMAYTWWANRRGDRLPAPGGPPVGRVVNVHQTTIGKQVEVMLTAEGFEKLRGLGLL